MQVTTLTMLEKIGVIVTTKELPVSTYESFGAPPLSRGGFFYIMQGRRRRICSGPARAKHKYLAN